VPKIKTLYAEMTQQFFDQKLLVVGLARNTEKTVQKDVFKLFASLRHCRSLSWLVIESDSSDNTLGALYSLERNLPSFRVISLGVLRHQMPHRTERIAHCRNAYLEELHSNPLYAEFDYVVVADLDGTNDLVTTEAFASCWTRSDWDVCTANQRGPYYDIWALRHPLWSPNDWNRQCQFLVSHKVRNENAKWAACYSRMITIDPTVAWIEVDSAFGGLAIYRRKVLSGVRYVGLDEAGDEVCEHVSLNSQIRSKGYRIFINPQFINTALTEHSRQLRLVPRLRRCLHGIRHQAKVRFLNH
jgi:hypothetical protein